MADIKAITPELLKSYDTKAKARQATVDQKTLTDAKAYTDEKVGTIGDLTTTAKDNVVAAVNELDTKVKKLGTTGAISIDTSTTTEGMSKSYTIKQGDSTIGTIDVPKDMVVSKGVLATVSGGNATYEDTEHTKESTENSDGTYLVLTLANASNDKIWINLTTLVDTYTAKAEAQQVQLTIDPSSREISATIVAGSITDAELAANAVTTQKIADANVTKAKLASDVTESLTKADNSVQSVTEGATNGTITVNNKEVPVHGLGSGAYVNITEATEEDINAIFAESSN